MTDAAPLFGWREGCNLVIALAIEGLPKLYALAYCELVAYG